MFIIFFVYIGFLLYKLCFDIVLSMFKLMAPYFDCKIVFHPSKKVLPPLVVFIVVVLVQI